MRLAVITDEIHQDIGRACAVIRQLGFGGLKFVR